MQGHRNNQRGLIDLEFVSRPSLFDNLPLDSQLTSYCLDPTVAMACV